MSGYIIGIDLGTTNTCIAVVKNKRVNIIPNAHGDRTIPSIVCIASDGRNIGQEARNQAHKYPDSTIFDIKRIIGRKFNDLITQNQIKQWPFSVVQKDGNPAVTIEDGNTTKYYYPEEVSAKILEEAKRTAEDYLGCDVTQAVVTVPAYFNNSQRQATKDAAVLAKLKVIGLISEPTAAAIAYGWENKSDVPRNVLIFDLGGGTFDVSIVAIDENDYQVKATTGDTHLGGSDFDHNMVQFFAQQFQQKYGKDLRSDKAAMRRLRSVCRETKEKLSLQLIVQVEILSFQDGKDFDTIISRVEFERLNDGLFQRTIDMVGTCLADAKLKKTDISDIVLVGGSTRIPKIQEMLQKYFDGMTLSKSVNPDEAVAYGAAIKAAWLDGGDKSEIPSDFKISDVTPLSLGVAIVGGKFDVFMKRNSRIPCTVTRNNYATARDDQSVIRTLIYEGERLLAKENTLLGELVIANLPLRKAGDVKFTYTFALDDDGVLHVDAVRRGADEQHGNIQIQLNQNRLSQKELQRIMRESEESKEEDKRKVKWSEAEYMLESYCLRARSKAKNMSNELGSDNTAKIVDACNAVLERMQSLGDILEIETCLRDIKAVCDTLFEQTFL